MYVTLPGYIVCVHACLVLCVCVLGHEVITLCRVRVFSAGFPHSTVPSSHCAVSHPDDWRRFMCCSELSSATRCPEAPLEQIKKPAISQGHPETSKASSESSFFLQKKKNLQHERCNRESRVESSRVERFLSLQKEILPFESSTTLLDCISVSNCKHI